MKPITKSVVRKLFRMKLRLIGISLVISMAMAMIVAGFYGSEVMESTISNLLDESKMPDIFIEFSSQEDADAVSTVLDSLDAIKAYDLRQKMSGIYTHEGEVFLSEFIGIENPDNQDINLFDLESGSFFTNTGEGIAITGMESQGISDGSTALFEIGGESFTLEITGIVRSAEYIFNSAYTEYSLPFSGNVVTVFLTLEDLQQYSGSGINDVIVLLEDDGSRDTVVESLDGFDIKAITYQESHPSVKFMNIGSGKLESMFPVMGIIFMFIGFISIFMTIIRLVQNDSRYIGVLMSLGYRRRKIITTYLLLGLVISVIGGSLGVVFALAFTQGFVEVGMSLYMSIETIVLPFIPQPFLVGLAFTFGVVLFSVWIPVRYITKTSVRDALEYKPRIKANILKIRSKRLSKITLLGIRNTTRNPVRLAITVFVVGLTLGVAGSWLVMMDSALGYMDDQLDADTWDLRADFITPLPTSSIDASYLDIDDDAIDYIIPYSSVNGELRSGNKRTGSLIIGSDRIADIKEYDLKEGSLDFSGAVITTKIVDELNVGLGDDIEIIIGPQTYSLDVTGIVYDVLAYSIYTEKSNLNAVLPESSSSGAFIKLHNPSDASTMATSIRNVQSVSKVTVHTDIQKTIDELIDLAAGFLGFFFILNLLITVIVAGSAVILSTMERDIEFATLDTLGISKREVAKSILVEMGIMATLASAIGLPFAYLFAQIMAIVLESVVFYFPVILAIGASITIFVVGIIFVLMSSIVPIRYSRKLDTEQTIRERTAG